MKVINFKDIGLPLDFEFTIGAAIAFSTFILSVQYNLGNFYFGYKSAEDKFYALYCILPFIYVPAIVYLASLYSQFWS
jgi:hypothetical protein